MSSDRNVYALSVAAFLAPIVGIAAPLGLAPLGIIFSLVVLALNRREGRQWRLPWTPIVLIILIAAWGFIGLAWALNPGQTAKTTLRLAGTAFLGLAVCAAFWRAPPGDLGLMRRSLAWGIGLAMAVVLADALSDRSLTYLFVAEPGVPAYTPYKSRFGRGATVTMLLIWPFTWLVWRRFGGIWAAAGLAAAMTVFFLADSGSTKITGLAALTTAALVMWRSRLAFIALRIGIVALFLAMPLAFSSIPPPQESFENWRWLPSSWHHRVTIWNFTAIHVAERPLQGWGMDASRDIPGGDEEVLVQRTEPDGRLIGASEPFLPLHPHNAILQFWLELGAVGTLGMAALFIWLLGRIENAVQDPALRAALTGSWVSALLISAFSYGFWQSWWQGTLWLTAALGVSLAASVRNSERAGVAPAK